MLWTGATNLQRPSAHRRSVLEKPQDAQDKDGDMEVVVDGSQQLLRPERRRGVSFDSLATNGPAE